MALIIEDEQVERMVADLAARAGISPEEAVARAIRTQWHEAPVTPSTFEPVKLPVDRAALEAIVRELSALPVADDRSLEEILYDEHGLPK